MNESKCFPSIGLLVDWCKSTALALTVCFNEWLHAAAQKLLSYGTRGWDYQQASPTLETLPTNSWRYGPRLTLMLLLQLLGRGLGGTGNVVGNSATNMVFVILFYTAAMKLLAS